MNRKSLEDRLKVLTREIGEREHSVAAAQRSLDQLKKEREGLVQKIANGSPAGVTVSDHALIRYLERTGQLDPQAFRELILTPDRIAAIKAGANSIKVDGVEMVVRGQTVVTVK